VGADLSPKSNKRSAAVHPQLFHSSGEAAAFVAEVRHPVRPVTIPVHQTQPLPHVRTAGRQRHPLS